MDIQARLLGCQGFFGNTERAGNSAVPVVNSLRGNNFHTRFKDLITSLSHIFSSGH